VERTARISGPLLAITRWWYLCETESYFPTSLPENELAHSGRFLSGMFVPAQLRKTPVLNQTLPPLVPDFLSSYFRSGPGLRHRGFRSRSP